jgi:acyl-CoA synthetase (NDP forming)
MADREESAGMDVFQRLSLPVYSYPESAVAALATMWQYKKMQGKKRPVETVSAKGRNVAPIQAVANRQAGIGEVFRLLQSYDIPTAPYLVTASWEKLLAFSEQTSGKLVLKTANAQIIHKSDEGLLHLNIEDQTALRTAYDAIRETVLSKLPVNVPPLFLIQRQLEGGSELVLGGKRDASFGPVVMAGFGGIFVEVLKDVVFRVAPVSVEEALDMLGDIKAQALFDGARGRDVIDRRVLAQTIHNFSRLLADHPEIMEMDLNPLIWQTELNQAVVVDARATIK